jgi:hypothetical protein
VLAGEAACAARAGLHRAPVLAAAAPMRLRRDHGRLEWFGGLLLLGGSNAASATRSMPTVHSHKQRRFMAFFTSSCNLAELGVYIGRV